MQGDTNSILLYEGKAKKVFKSTEDTVMMFFKDDATAGNLSLIHI